ncbi:hypothetical protein P154DRAFT_446600 [Amniculicola lignicola CBS 123094]|uniref:RRM domain-containing protein n=1 Tax=Amniculicola lignicola CBS 123094 TaxID=1392246 RepID=A0A6A5VZ03_9PLEO|nr:hypothetical protein P154DRAFT_446600 [Amniculicola lignicola CBS 123094]
MSLGDFLGDQSLGSWADEMEDAPMPGGEFPAYARTGYGGERRTFSSAGGFGDRAFDRGGGSGFAREALPLPSKPPYTAHLGNLSFDATEGDISDFFGDCAVTNVRIVEDKMDRKPKGFGYVEFGTLDGLKKALDLSGTQFQGRNIRVSVAEPPKDREGSKDMSDWTRKGPLPELPGGGRRTSDRGGFGRGGFEAAGSDAGSERGERRRPPPFEGDGKVRDFGNWERRGPLSPVPGAGPTREGGRLRSSEAPRERRQSPNWGEGRGEKGSQDGSRPPRREFQDRPGYERQPTAPEMNNQWRTTMKTDAPAKSPAGTPDASVPSSPAPQPAAPATRPRLNLAKRTVSEAVPDHASSASEPSKSNPFGAARPIDTAGREKEIEEKRQLAIRQKKEADDKAREDRRAKEAADRAARETVPATPTTEKSQEGSVEDKSAARPYEILQRSGEEEQAEEGGDAVDPDANGEIVQDKAVKPQEVVRDPPKSEGTWRRKSGTPAAAGGSPTEKVEDDGWSTVQKPAKGGRRGPQRAIAS